MPTRQEQHASLYMAKSQVDELRELIEVLERAYQP